MSRVEGWIVRRAPALIIGLTILTAILAVVVVWVALDNSQQDKRLAGVKEAGPCRAAVLEHGLPKGLFNEECARQSDYVLWSYCIRHSVRPCPGLPKSLRPKRHGILPKPHAPKGGDAVQPSPPASQQPSPPSGGPPSNPKPPENPPPKPPGVLDPVLDPVCHLNPLGIRVCS